MNAAILVLVQSQSPMPRRSRAFQRALRPDVEVRARVLGICDSQLSSAAVLVAAAAAARAAAAVSAVRVTRRAAVRRADPVVVLRGLDDRGVEQIGRRIHEDCLLVYRIKTCSVLGAPSRGLAEGSVQRRLTDFLVLRQQIVIRRVAGVAPAGIAVTRVVVVVVPCHVVHEAEIARFLLDSVGRQRAPAAARVAVYLVALVDYQ